MVISKKKLAVLSCGAHLIVALILCRLAPSIIERLFLLVSIGMIGGIQSHCIRNIQPPTSS